MLTFLKDVLNHFSNSNTFQKGAALAYYLVFSFLPIIVILVSLAGLFFGKQAVSGEIYNQLEDTFGIDGATQIQDIIKNQHIHHSGVLSTIIGFVTLALSASGMLSQIHNAFNSVWDMKEKPRSSILKYLSKHAISFLILVGLFSLILVSTASNAFFIKHAEWLSGTHTLWYLYEHLISFILISLAFATMFKFLGDAKVHWKVTLMAGILTSVLFLLGKIGIAFYIGKSHVSSTFGSASILALLMLWVYYTSQIIFLGASLVKVLGDKLGLAIVPNSGAVRVDHHEVE